MEAVEQKLLAPDFRKKWLSTLNEEALADSWQMLVGTITKATLAAFPPEEKQEDEYKELTKKRIALLKERAQHQQDLRGTDEDTAAGLKLELVMISRRARKMRQQTATETSRLIEEIWEAW